jgi:flavodoxin
MSEQKKIFTRGFIKVLAASLLGVMAILTFVGVSTSYAAPAGDKNMLIIYYSWGGNTRYMAEQIQSLTGADIFELTTVNPYPTEYRPTTEQARRELDSDYRPALSSKIDNLADYDIVFIGSPNWWGTLAMPFFTFLEEHDMSGKTLVPFMTHEGSAFGRTLTDLRNLCPNATLIEGLAVRGGRVREVRPEITQWLTRIGMIS